MIIQGDKTKIFKQPGEQTTFRASGIVVKTASYITAQDPDNPNDFGPAWFFPGIPLVNISQSRTSGLTTYNVTRYEMPPKLFGPEYRPRFKQTPAIGVYNYSGVSFNYTKIFTLISLPSTTISDPENSGVNIGEGLYVDMNAVGIWNNNTGSGAAYNATVLDNAGAVITPNMVLKSRTVTQLGAIYEIDYVWELKYFSPDNLYSN